MSNLALKHPVRLNVSRSRHEIPGLSYGVVEGVEQHTVLVKTHGGTVKASRAVSCLLDPVENDKVLLAGGSGENWVLAVLERAGEKDATLSFEGTVRMLAPEGGMHFSAAETISVSSETVAMNAENATAVLGSANLVARVYKSCIDNAVSVMGKINLFCSHMRQHLVRSYKRVDGQEVEHAAKRLIQAESLDIVSRKTDIASGERVSVNANQFHVN